MFVDENGSVISINRIDLDEQDIVFETTHSGGRVAMKLCHRPSGICVQGDTYPDGQNMSSGKLKQSLLLELENKINKKCGVFL